MAYFDQSFTKDHRGLAARIKTLFETPFDQRNRQLTAEVAALRALSDDELAARGIVRDQILFHVFGARTK